MVDDSGGKTSRREFLGRTTAVVAGGVAAGQAVAGDAGASSETVASKFQPEAFWKDRMTAPDDGKKLGWLVDTRRCFGCHACEVSCKSENDVPLGKFIRQTVYKDVGEYPKVARVFLPMACQHCEDAPCIKACPCGALHKEVGGTVAVNYNVCSGHGTCAEVCPYGAIYLDPVAKQAVKCHNCYHRLEPKSRISLAKAELEADEGVTQLRSEKGTKPRTWFAGRAPVEAEDRVPREGESFSPEAYNIYNWKAALDETEGG